MNQHTQFKLFAAFAAIYFIWGSTYLAIKYALTALPPLLMMGTRSLAAGFILYLWSRTRGAGSVKRENLLPLMTIAILFFLVGHGLLAWGQQRIASGSAALLVASEPLWIALLEAFLVREDKASLRAIIGMACGLSGLGLLLAPGQHFSTAHLDLGGAFAILVGTLSWSIGAVYSRVAKLPSAPGLVAGLQLMVGGFLLIVTGLLLGEGGRLQIAALSLRPLLSWLYLVVFGSVIAFTAYVWLLRVTSARRVATHTYVNPLIAVFLGWALAGEPVSLQTFAATIVIVLSVYLVLGQNRERRNSSLPIASKTKVVSSSNAMGPWPLPAAAPNPESK